MDDTEHDTTMSGNAEAQADGQALQRPAKAGRHEQLAYDRLEVPYPIANGVNVYRVGDTLIDTGHMSWLEPFEAELHDGRLAGIERVVLTHPHCDHIGGSTRIPEIADLPHIVYEGAPSLLNDVEGYFRSVNDENKAFYAGLPDPDEEQKAFLEKQFPMDEPYLDVNVDRIVTDGDTVTVGRYDCEVLHTPGHSAHHMSLLHRESGTMFSGDIVSENGHYAYGPVHWNLAAYEQSLERLLEVTPTVERMLPGHGSVMTDPKDRVETALQQFRRTKDTLSEAIHTQDEITARTLTMDVLGGHPGLAATVVVYLHHLEELGECSLAFESDGVYAKASGEN